MERLGFIGMGNMAQALALGFIRSGSIAKELSGVGERCMRREVIAEAVVDFIQVRMPE